MSAAAVAAHQAQQSDPQRAATDDGPAIGAEETPQADDQKHGKDPKEKKRLFGLLRKKEDKSKSAEPSSLSPDTIPTASPPPSSPPAVTSHNYTPSATTTTTPSKPIPTSAPHAPHMTPPSNPTHLPSSSSPQGHSISAAASPSRYVRSASPRLHSPASSQIFERNVQEAPLPDELQAAIPHHIQTEDYIPPILEASSLAITDEQLNPDEVEIVMHSAHQPAASTIAHPDGVGGGLGSGTLSPLSLGHGAGADVPPLGPAAALSESTTSLDEQGSHYGSLDASDVRRLSFISFADVVQGEHAHDGVNASGFLPKDLHMSMISNTSNRSPSPVRSPASSHGAGELGLSPPTSGAPSVKGVELGKQPQPNIGAFPASPGSLVGAQSPSLGGSEIHVETMRQALRKTGSGDLSHARSPVSPIERSSVFGSGPIAEGK